MQIKFNQLKDSVELSLPLSFNELEKVECRTLSQVKNVINYFIEISSFIDDEIRERLFKDINSVPNYSLKIKMSNIKKGKYDNEKMLSKLMDLVEDNIEKKDLLTIQLLSFTNLKKIVKKENIEELKNLFYVEEPKTVNAITIGITKTIKDPQEQHRVAMNIINNN